MFGRMIRMLIEDFNEYVGRERKPDEPSAPPDQVVMLRSGKKAGEWTKGTTKNGDVIYTDTLGTLATLWRDKCDGLYLIVTRMDRWPRIDEIRGAYEMLLPSVPMVISLTGKAFERQDGDPYAVECV